MRSRAPARPGCSSTSRASRAGTTAFLFFTYLYAPTALGVPLVADRALVVPTAHPEPPLDFDVFAEVFDAAARAALQHP